MAQQIVSFRLADRIASAFDGLDLTVVPKTRYSNAELTSHDEGADGLFVMRENGYSLIPLILGIILGPIIEGSFLRSMLVSGNDPLYFFGSSIAILLWVLTVLALFIQPISNVIRGVIANRTDYLN